MSSSKPNHSSTCPCCNPALSILAEAFVMPRRMFLLGTGSFLATVAMGGAVNANSPQMEGQENKLLAKATPFADTIYLNGSIITVNDQQPSAEAVAVKNGKILAVGDRRTVEALKDKNTKVIDLNGKTMLPGFIDPHGHIYQQGMSAIVADLLPYPDGTVDSIAKLQAKLTDWGKTPTANTFGWIVASGYDDAQLKEQRHPTRRDLDAVSTTVPILIIHQSGHLGVLNSKALEVLKVTAATQNPPGGVIRRESDGQPDGVLEENAFYLALSYVSKKISTTLSPDDALDILHKGANIYASYGFTTAQEGRAIKSVYDAIVASAAAKPLPIDVAVYVDYLANPDLQKWNVSRTYTNRVRLAGAKLTFDGSPQGRTAWLSKPYYKVPEGQPATYNGYGVMTDEQAIERVDSAYKHAMCN